MVREAQVETVNYNFIYFWRCLIVFRFLFFFTGICLFINLYSCKSGGNRDEQVSNQIDPKTDEAPDLYDAETAEFLQKWKIEPVPSNFANDSLSLTTSSAIRSLANFLKPKSGVLGFSIKEVNGRIRLQKPTQGVAARGGDSGAATSFEQLIKQENYRVDLRLSGGDYIFTSKDGNKYIYLKPKQGAEEIVELRELEGGAVGVSDNLISWSIKDTSKASPDDTSFEIAHYMAQSLRTRTVEGAESANVSSDLKLLRKKVDAALEENNMDLNLIDGLKISRPLKDKIRNLRLNGIKPTDSKISELFTELIGTKEITKLTKVLDAITFTRSKKLAALFMDRVEGPFDATVTAKLSEASVLGGWQSVKRVLDHPKAADTLRSESWAVLGRDLAKLYPDDVFELINYGEFPVLDAKETALIAEELVRSGKSERFFELLDSSKTSKLDDELTYELAEELALRGSGRSLVEKFRKHPKAGDLSGDDMEEIFE